MSTKSLSTNRLMRFPGGRKGEKDSQVEGKKAHIVDTLKISLNNAQTFNSCLTENITISLNIPTGHRCYANNICLFYGLYKIYIYILRMTGGSSRY